MPIRLLVVARHPIRAEDFQLAPEDDIEFTLVSRGLSSLPQLVRSTEADVVIVDLEFAQEKTFSAIAAVSSEMPGFPILTLTRDPPRYDVVARAIASGASGFIDVDADPDELLLAVHALRDGGDWLPAADTKEILRGVAGDLDVTAAERRSKLMTVALGLIPLAGAVAALLSLLWREYLGQIGVRPIDLGVDPTNRVVDAVSALLLMIGVFGPLLYVTNWLDLLESVVDERPGLAWLARSRRVTGLVVSLAILAAGVALSFIADLVLIIFIGPIVLLSILVLILGLSPDVPPMLRIRLVRPQRAVVAATAAVVIFLALLSSEVLLMGPRFSASGADGILAPEFLGFGAQPVLVVIVDGSLPARELLYLGGNADLYVLVDPCNDDEVSMISVGSSRLKIIDEVACDR
ncbi:MAG: hypothetical protein ACC652_02065 [Acidimicrobiales bacterium]